MQGNNQATNSSKPEGTPIIEKAVLIISEYLGKYSGDMYRNFYTQNPNEKLIISSLQELLSEVVGPGKAQQIISENF